MENTVAAIAWANGFQIVVALLVYPIILILLFSLILFSDSL